MLADPATLLSDSDQLWRRTPEFWTNNTDSATVDFVRRFQDGVMTVLLEAAARNESAKLARTDKQRPFVVAPWWPILVNATDVSTTSAFLIGSVTIGPSVVVGSGGPSTWLVRSGVQLVSAGGLATSPSPDADVIPPTGYTVQDGHLVFASDPTTQFLAVDIDGINHFVIWVRDAAIDVDTVFASRGFDAQARGVSGERYQLALDTFIRYLRNYNRRDFEAGLHAAVAAPYALEQGTVAFEYTDTAAVTQATGTNVYRTPTSYTPLYTVGDTIVGPVSDALFVAHNDQALAATPTQLPGISLNVPGIADPVSFGNVDTTWSIDDTVSPIDVRFPVGDSNNAFWLAVYERSQAAPAGQDLASLLGITSSADVVNVNPMKFVIEQFLLGSSAFIATDAALINVPVIPFADWARRYLPPHTYIALMTKLGHLGVSTLDLTTQGGSVSAFYFEQLVDTLDLNVEAPDLTPLVVVT